MRKAGWTIVVLIILVIGLGIFQVVRSPPAQTATVTGPVAVRVPGSSSLPWPASGQGAVAIGSTGSVRTSGPLSTSPIASLAKMMTAYVVLKDHPLTGDGAGPSIIVTSADVAAYTADVAASDSVLQVTAGESLTEQQALEALLIASADNVADILAQWDAGSVSAFVAKMNSTAHALGMAHTTYTDPSGLATTTVSNASDQLVITRTAMASPTFASIVAMPAATFPLAGMVQNFDYDVGHDGIIGVKTGSDSAALGCWAFAATRTVAGTSQTVYGVVLGIPAAATGLVEPALAAGEALANALPGTVRSMTVVPAGTVVGYVTAPWRTRPVPIKTVNAVHGLVSSGSRIKPRVTVGPTIGTTVRQGQRVGTLVTNDVRGVGSTPLVIGTTGSGPTMRWKLAHF